MKRYRSTVLVCGGTGCVAAGSLKVYEEFLKEIRKFKLEDEINLVMTGCNGICDQGPVIIVYPEGTFYSRIQVENVARIVEEHLLKGRVAKEFLYERPEADGTVPVFNEIGFFRSQHKVTRKNCGVIDPRKIDEYIAVDGWQALAKVLKEMTQEQVIEEVKNAGLRGRGGAGFPTGLKWQFCRQAKGDQKYIMCNADEGDPGAFMDRSQLEGDPQSVLEGMAIGAYAIGADKGIIYVRAEYPLAIELLTNAIDQAREYGLLGENIFGTDFSFDIEIMMGAGAFVCGEETALMRSVEGKRGEPRPRPPFPAIAGLYEKPTVLNNVETLGTIPIIIRNGADWYSSIGTEKSKGTKIFSLTGTIVNNGLVEVDMGTPMGDIIYDIGGGIPNGKQFKSVQCGGPSGGCIPKQHLDTPIDYDELNALGAIMGSGGLVVMNEDTCMVDTARFFLDFVQDESCGKCPPCRIGTKRMLEILTRITEGKGKEGDIEELENLGKLIKETALCGLGQTAPNPVLSTIRFFRDEYEAHIKEKRCPAVVCGSLFRAPCEHTCPVGLDAAGYVALIGNKKFDEAFDLILERNPLPGICGRVCTHPCESKCRRAMIDEPIAIRTLKRFAYDYACNGGKRTPYLSEKPVLDKDPVAVIGSGPAGLTCAYQLAKKGHPVTIFEKLPVEGGMLAVGIPEYRLPRDVIKSDIDRIKEFGVEIKTGVEIGKDKSIDDLYKEGFKAVFIGIGTQKGWDLGIEGESLKGVYNGLDFLRDFNLGEKMDGGKSAAVIGGGNAAIDASRTLLRLGYENVYLVYRRTKSEMPANEEEIEEAFKEGVKPYFLAAPLKIEGDGGKVSSLVCQRMSLGKFDRSGRRRPEPVEGTEFELQVDMVIPAIGQEVDAGKLFDGSGVEVSDRGWIKVDKYSYATNREGVFAGGDAVGEEATVIWAMKTGMKAASEIDKYLGGDGILVDAVRTSAGIDEIKPLVGEEVEEQAREKQKMLALDSRTGNFDETELGFDVETAVKEAGRCLRCDFGREAELARRIQQQ
ncbi:MAG TPA: NADH-quinone oxidoreductase subunit NuoF [bacterium]|nr:NADH-quinone oxidoreductase subunit NuoF [bacterium]